MALNTVTMLGNHHHYICPNFFINPNKTLYPLNNNPLSHLPPAPTALFSLYKFTNSSFLM